MVHTSGLSRTGGTAKKKTTTPTPKPTSQPSGTVGAVAGAAAITSSTPQSTPSNTTAQPSSTSKFFSPQTTAPTVTKTVNASNAPYAATQNTGAKTVGATNVRGLKVENNPQAKPQNFTLATEKSGNKYIIVSQGSLDKKIIQDAAKAGVALTSSTTTNFAGASGVPIIVDEGLSGYYQGLIYNATPAATESPTIITEQTIGEGKYFDDSPTFDSDINYKTDEKADNPIADNVQLTANTIYDLPNGQGAANTSTASTVTPDQNWSMGQNMYTGNSDSLSVLSEKDQADYLQDLYLTQRNQEIVPTTSYNAFAANGIGTGSATLDAGFDNLKGSFGNILSGKWMPFIIIGIIGLLVLSFLKPKASGGTGMAPTMVRYG